MIFPLPETFTETAFGIASLIGIIFAGISLSGKTRSYAIRMCGIFFLLALAVISNSFGTYFIAIFILATLVTELDFLQNLAAIVRSDKNYFAYKAAVQGSATRESVDRQAGISRQKRELMEYMILNTLWTKQVNRWPDLSAFFTFTMNFAAHSEAQKFREAAAKLQGEDIITVSDNGQYMLTINGFDYCKQHYTEFPKEQWWPEEPIKLDKLKEVIEEKC